MPKRQADSETADKPAKCSKLGLDGSNGSKKSEDDDALQPNVREIINDLTECGVCVRTFNYTQRCPKILVCNHTYCLECLEKLVPYNQKLRYPKISCPFCRKNVQLPKLGPITLPSNMTILKLLETLPAPSWVDFTPALPVPSAFDHERKKQTCMSWIRNDTNSDKKYRLNFNTPKDVEQYWSKLMELYTSRPSPLRVTMPSGKIFTLSSKDPSWDPSKIKVKMTTHCLPPASPTESLVESIPSNSSTGPVTPSPGSTDASVVNATSGNGQA